ncbi:MAG: peptide chain release factor N(5)-glutamine methyltransferase [Planctomycetota bacterium]|nr:peptide chain release factor N(5)-glutamine methyltransferase [Planctomycetota bacterium]
MTAAPTEAADSTGDWTIRRIIEWTTGFLERHDSESPRLDAELMLAHVLECRRIQLYTNYADLPTADQRQHMRELVRRRALREPVSYLVGHREFFGLDFHLTSDVLIPRPETESLVLEAIEAARIQPGPACIAEVGVGSGCISIALATNLPNATVTGTEISSAALNVAMQNAVKHGVKDRVLLLEGSCFDPIPADRRFHIIVSNPPYVTDAEYASLQPEIRLHEPRVALTAGEDGLDVIRVLVRDAPKWLQSGGHLMLELDPAQAAATQALMTDDVWEDVRAVRDLNGQERIVCGRLR